MTETNNEDVQVTQPNANGITFAYVDETGNEVECRVLYFFHAEHNNKHYMVYTTGVVGEDGEEVSAARIDPVAFDALMAGEEADLALEPLTEDIEWAIVADTLKRVVDDDIQVDSSEVVADGVDLQVAPEN